MNQASPCSLNILEFQNSNSIISSSSSSPFQANLADAAFNKAHPGLCRKRINLKNQFILQRCMFSVKEDMIIAKYYCIYGKNWTKIASHLDFRTSGMVKNRFYSYIRKQNIMKTLLFIKDDLEAEGEIESQDEEMVEDFHIFIPPKNMFRVALNSC
jgi:hypothetical protein